VCVYESAREVLAVSATTNLVIGTAAVSLTGACFAARAHGYLPAEVTPEIMVLFFGITGAFYVTLQLVVKAVRGWSAPAGAAPDRRAESLQPASMVSEKA
jgi:hypothetical protein